MLQEKGAYFEESWTKVILFDLIKQNKLLRIYKRRWMIEKPQPWSSETATITLRSESNWSWVADKNVAQDAKTIVKLTENFCKRDTWRLVDSMYTCGVCEEMCISIDLFWLLLKDKIITNNV